MASRKEHKRKQKKRSGSAGGASQGGNPSRRLELNSLDLLSALHGVPRASDGKSGRAGDRESRGKESPLPVREASPEEAKLPPQTAGAAFAPSPSQNLAAAPAASEQTCSDAAERAAAERAAAERAAAERAAAERAAAERAAAERAAAERAAAERAAAERAAAERAADEPVRSEEEARRREAELRERERLEAGSERRRQAAAEAERARQDAELAAEDKRRRLAEEKKRLLAESGDTSAAAGNEGGRAMFTVSAPPPLEVDNPCWQKTPEMYHGCSGMPEPFGSSAAAEPGMPVTLRAEADAPGPGPRHDAPESPEGSLLRKASTVPVPREKRMYIVMVTPEVAPCAKVGGLGDVVLGLGRELMKRGHGVEVIAPMYAGMRYDLIQDLHEEYSELWCPHYGEWRPEKVFQGTVEGGLQVNFITGGTYTDRPNIYGYDDDLQRFTYFSRQALEFMYKSNRRPDIIHCHDWATGLVPPILWDIYEKLGWDNSRVVYTIHNNECQGLCGFPEKLLSMVGLDAGKYLTPDRMQDDTNRTCINMMKAGIIFSNFVTTVSPTYAGELKTAAGGRGLQNTIARNSAKVGGVLNGIDYDSWNPQTDGKLAARYSVGDDFYAKYENKKALRDWLGLWDSWKPIVSVVTRLTHQKGLDLIKHAVYAVQEMQGQFVLLGSAPDPKVNAEFLRMQHELRDNHDVNLYIGYHEDLSRLIYAGSDMFLVPSLYEPCGLTQMISLRYGTVPIVRETGGLVDSVFDLDNSGLGLNEANGFTFRDPTPLSLNYGLERGIRLWYDNPEAFGRLAKNGMRYDYSWRHPAEHYENIYTYIKA